MLDSYNIPVYYCMVCGHVIDGLIVQQLKTTLIECPNCNEELVANFQRDVVKPEIE